MRHSWTSIAYAAALIAIAAPSLGKPNNSGPTSEQIYCQNRAVNDYWDQVKACDAALSDLPSQNALCKSDAAADLSRRKAACLGGATRQIRKTGATGGQAPVTRTGQ